MTGIPDGEKRLLFLPLGGAGEIGMNLSLYGCRGKWLAVDMGIGFADPVRMPGIDVETPDIAFPESVRDSLVALVLTHAHEDHLGAVVWLWPRLGCPVHGSPLALAVLGRRLEEAGLGTEMTSLFRPGDCLDLPPFRVSSLAVTHSIPESMSLVIRTPAGTVFHTGDFKLDPAPRLGPPVDEAAIARAGDTGILATVCDSTNVFVPGNAGSEQEVADVLSREIAAADGLVVVTGFSSNLARLDSIIRAAGASGRRVALAGRALWRMTEAARSAGLLPGDWPELLPGHGIPRDLPGNRLLVVATGCQGEPAAALARIASGQNPLVRLGQGDRVIFSSRIIPGNERRIGTLVNQLVRAGVDVVTSRDRGVHVSGHPGRADLERIYRLLRPRISIPVHGEDRHLARHAALARDIGVPHAIAPRNGQVIALDPENGPEIIASVRAGRLAIDGGRTIASDDPSIVWRRRAMYNGHVHVVLPVAGGRLAGWPLVSFRGVSPDDAELGRQASRLIVRNAERDGAMDESGIRRSVRTVVRGAGRRHPGIDVDFLDVVAPGTGRGRRFRTGETGK